MSFNCHSVCLFVCYSCTAWVIRFLFCTRQVRRAPACCARSTDAHGSRREKKGLFLYTHLFNTSMPKCKLSFKWVLSPGFKLMDSDAKIWTVLQGLLAWRVMHDTWHVRFLFVTSSSLPLIFDTLSSFQGTISQYFSTMTCPVCQELTPTDLCINCRARPQLSAVTLASRVRKWERTHQLLVEVGWVPLWWRHDLHHGTWYNTIQYWF